MLLGAHMFLKADPESAVTDEVGLFIAAQGNDR